MDDLTISSAMGSEELASITARLLAQLPAWFGDADANAAYVRSARELPAWVARTGDRAVGVLLWRRHFPEAAEIHLMAIASEWHRRGIGKAMIDSLVADLHDDGCRVVQVKTLGASRPDQHYASTRSFYRSVGFMPLEEVTTIWPSSPCLMMVKPLG